MGKVAKAVEQRKKEKHLNTEEYISLLHWYIQECSKVDREFIAARNDLTEAYNSRRREIIEKCQD